MFVDTQPGAVILGDKPQKKYCGHEVWTLVGSHVKEAVVCVLGLFKLASPVLVKNRKTVKERKALL